MVFRRAAGIALAILKSVPLSLSLMLKELQGPVTRAKKKKKKKKKKKGFQGQTMFYSPHSSRERAHGTRIV